MSDFEVMSMVLPVTLLAVIVYTVINILSFKDILRRIGLMKIARRDFYECGVKPQNKKPIKVSLQFLLICVFFYFIRYRISLPISTRIWFIFFRFIWFYSGIIFFFNIFIASLTFDYTRHALVWQE